MTTYEHVLPPTKAPAVSNGLAISAFILAFFVPPAAIVLGHVSRGEARRADRQPSGLATAGLVLGYIFTVLAVLAVVIVVAAAANTGDATDQYINCVNQAIANGTSTAVCQ